MSKRNLFTTIIFITILLSLSSCNTGAFLDFFISATPTSKSILVTTMTAATPEPETTPVQESTAIEATSNTLILWVPPEFFSSQDISDRLLQAQIEDFQDRYDYEVQLRIKESSGPNGMLPALESTLKTAPAAAPSLVLLSHSDLQRAASQGWIQPLEEIQQMLLTEDWYDYARLLGVSQNKGYGIPFAADAMILAYRPALVGATPQNWNDVLSHEAVVLFPAADPKALFTLQLYLSRGGTLFNDQSQLMLDSSVLEKVLEFYSNSANSDVFPSWLLRYTTDQEIWSSFTQKSANWAVSRTSYYLSQLPVDVAAIPVPSLGSESTSLVSGWLWAFSEPNPNQQEISLKLLEHLVDEQFQANWTVAAGYLPVRPSSMAAWQNQVVKSLLSQITLSAQSQPTEETLEIIGPILSDAVNLVLSGEATPFQASRSAVEKLNTR